jgi:hypothetical protein
MTEIRDFTSPNKVTSAMDTTGIVQQAGTFDVSGGPYPSGTYMPVESIDYINCSSKYAVNAIITAGATGTLNAISNIDANKCALKIGTTNRQYNFTNPTTLLTTVGQPLIASLSPTTPVNPTGSVSIDLAS